MKKPNKENNLLVKNPELCKEWHPTKNGDLTPKNFTKYSGQKVWWKCKKCSYEWFAQIKNRSNGCNCPSCTGRVATEFNCLETTHPEIAKEWHPTKNGNLTTKNVTKGSHKRVWWKCKKCGYEYKVEIYNKENGCPSCTGKVVTEFNCLETTHPEIAKEWHPTRNGNLTTKNVTQSSNKKIWWKCKKCGYEWIVEVKEKTDYKDNGCFNCKSLLFNFPDICNELHPTKNKNFNLEKTTQFSGKKVWWKCKKCNHIWNAHIYSRTFSGNGCPKCTKGSKISKSCSLWLDELGIPNDSDHREVKIKIKNKRFEFDGYDPKTNIVYEYLGNFWHGNPEFYNPNDIHPIRKITYGEIYKNTLNRIKILEENGYKVIYKWGD